MLYIFSSTNTMYTYSLMGGIFMNENSMNNFLEEICSKHWMCICCLPAIDLTECPLLSCAQPGNQGEMVRN